MYGFRHLYYMSFVKILFPLRNYINFLKHKPFGIKLHGIICSPELVLRPLVLF